MTFDGKLSWLNVASIASNAFDTEQQNASPNAAILSKRSAKGVCASNLTRLALFV